MLRAAECFLEPEDVGEDNMLKKEEAQAITDRILAFSDADETEVMLHSGQNALTRFANNGIHQNNAVRSQSSSIRVVLGKKTGRVSVNQWDDATLQRALRKAKEVALAQPDDPNLLPLVGPNTFREVPAFFEDTHALSPDDRAEVVEQVIAMGLPKQMIAAGAYSNSGGISAIANSKGLFAYQPRTDAEFTVTFTTQDSASSGWCAYASPDVRTLDPLRFSEIPLERAEYGRDPLPLEPGRYTVVLEEPAVASLLEYLGYLGFGALAVEEGRSFMCGKFGQSITGAHITIVDDVYHPLHLGSPFDAEGVPVQQVVLIENGIAKSVVYDRATAHRADRESTGHGLPYPNAFGPYASNLVLAGAEDTVEDMIASTKQGILVTRFWYNRVVDPVKTIITGMTRDGTFLIENGQVTRSVRNLRYNMSVLEAFAQAEMISSTQRLCEGVVAPAMKVRDFHFTGATG